MEYKDKIVYFETYCQKCKYVNKKADEEPCNECLSIPAREYSHKPIKFEENKTKE